VANEVLIPGRTVEWVEQLLWWLQIFVLDMGFGGGGRNGDFERGPEGEELIGDDSEGPDINLAGVAASGRAGTPVTKNGKE
jgi:hypothetical protein